MEKIGAYTAILITASVLVISIFLVQWKVRQEATNKKKRKKLAKRVTR